MATTDREEQRWFSLRETILHQERWLRRQGSLVRKTIAGRSYWYLRYHEVNERQRRVHRALYVGADAELVDRTRRLIEELREQARELDWLGAMIKVAKRLLRLAVTTRRKRNRKLL